MNISKYGIGTRLLVCVMVCALLCFSVMRPVTAHATGAELAAVAPVVGISAPVAIAGILIALGVAWVASGEFEELCETIAAAIPDDFLSSLGDTYVSGLSYNNTYYVAQDVVEWVTDYLYRSESPVIQNGAFASTSDYWDMFDYMIGVFGADSALGQTYINIANNSDYCYRISTRYGYSYIWSDHAETYVDENNETLLLVQPPFVGVVRNVRNSDPSTILEQTSESYLGNGTFTVPISNVDSEEMTISSRYIVALSDTLGDSLDDTEYSVWTSYAITAEEVEYLPITIVDTVENTGKIPQAESWSGTQSTSDAVTKTDATVNVDTKTDASAPTYSGILGWLQKIWSALNSILQNVEAWWIEATATVGEFISDGVESIVTGITDLGTKVNALGNLISQRVVVLLTTINQTITSVGTTIVDGIVSGVEAIFVPSTDYVTAKVEALRARFDFIDPVITFANQIKDMFYEGSPPVIYIPLNAAEGSYYYGEKVVFLDMSWYSRYKGTGDAIISGFLWALFGWRMLLKLPGIINGVGGSVGSITRYSKEGGD